ncbi:ganglioside GM2 activator-like [Branchiostoma floridae]|uniref:Ganglioside GM2 activator-like n=1 Tax=Branchiostoma floridae TaxID=7739 RepID=A0A9J7LM56_BRAFL|nr:ganglioside GM2 activator-like [Branchiostoma floridae]XP_035685464.1 ganglioside GM2 activator-like [Branchiostoma floridae]
MILKAALFVAMVMVATPATGHSFSDCGGSAIKVELGSIRLPDPIVLRAGRQESIGGKASLKKDLPDRLKVKLKVEKKILWGYVTVPCVNELGSCTYDIACNNPIVTQLGIKCPVKAGDHCLNKVITIPNISIPSFLASGQYKMRMEVRSYYSGEMLGCGQAQLAIST